MPETDPYAEFQKKPADDPYAEFNIPHQPEAPQPSAFSRFVAPAGAAFKSLMLGSGPKTEQIPVPEGTQEQPGFYLPRPSLGNAWNNLKRDVTENPLVKAVREHDYPTAAGMALTVLPGLLQGRFAPETAEGPAVNVPVPSPAPLIRGVRAVAANPTARDVAGLIDPRLSHAMNLVNKGGRIFDVIRGGRGGPGLSDTLNFESSPPQPTPYRFGQPPPFRPKALIGPAPITPEPPADSSFVRSAPAMANPPNPARALPEAPRIIEMPGRPDTSFVRGVSEPYPANRMANRALPAGQQIIDVRPAPVNGHPAPPMTAEQLFNEMKASGTVPAETKPGQPINERPEQSPEPFKAKARAARGSNAAMLGNLLHQTGIPSEHLIRMDPTDWEQLSKAANIEFPASGKAQEKLIRDVGTHLRKMEGNGR